MPYSRLSVASIALLAFTLVVYFALATPQILTGDEPRYLMYARSLIEHGRFVMTLAEWRKLYRESTGGEAVGLPVGEGNAVLMNGVYVPTLLAPLSLLGLVALRAATLLAGLIGLAWLLPLCRRTGSETAAIFATCVAGLSIPLLPYLHLFYMETFLFALVTIGWWRLQTAARTMSGDVLTACLLLAIPYVHLRGAVVAATLYLGLLWQLWSNGQRRRAVALLALAAIALALLVAANLAIYGAIAGPVNSARPPMPLQWFGVLSMQLFNVHHGLLAYAPVWLLGYAGLLAGALRGSSLARQGLVLAFVAAVTGVGINPGECWPARFWVLSVPMLAVGLCLWWQMSRAWLLRGLTVALIAFTALNTLQFLLEPNSLLENRQAGTTYQLWFDQFGHFDFGLPLPVETDDPADVRAATVLAVGSLLFIAFAIAGVLRRPIWALGSAALLVAALDAAHVRLVPPTEYRVDRKADRLTITMRQPIRAGYVQIGRSWEPLFVPPLWPRYDVETTGAAGHAEHLMAARDVMPVSCRDGIRTITITTQSTIDLAAQSRARLDLYRSRSLIWRWIGWLHDRC